MQLTSVTLPPQGHAARWLVAWLIVAAGCAAWAAYYVRQEDLAYLSDFRQYWKLYWSFGELFRASPVAWASQMLTAVHSSEYNPLFTAPLLPFNLVWGRERLGYIEAVVLLYMLPAMAVAWFVIRRWIKAGAIALPWGAELSILCMVVLLTSFWIPTLRGYPDVWGLVPLGVALWWLRETDFTRPQRWTTLVGLALCIYAPFLIRKWYVFSIIAIVVAHSLMATWQLQRAKAPPRVWGWWLFNHAVIGALVLVFVFTIQGRMAINALTYAYADSYVAFQRTGAEHARDLLSRHGILMPLLCLSGWWISVRRKSPLAPTFAYLWLCVLLTIALFTRVQGLDTHHHLPVGLFFCLMGGLAIGEWTDALRQHPARLRGLWLAVCAVVVFNFANVFVPSLQVPTASLLQERRFPPLKLENPEAYRRLAAFIEREVGSHERVSIVASNAVLSQTMVENFLTDEAIQKIAPLAEVDEYEGFNLRPLYSDYLVVPNPPQIIRARHQNVVSVPSNLLLQGRGIGAAYREVQRIEVVAGLQFLVFKKQRPFREDELKALLDEFAALPRPPGLEYTPMQLSLLATQADVSTAGAQPHRIDMVGGGEWAVLVPPRTELTLTPGFWPDWVASPVPPGARAQSATAELIFSVQLPADRVPLCHASSPRMRVMLDNQLLLAKDFNTAVVDYFKVLPQHVPRLQFHILGGDDPGCDRILIDHRTD